MNKLQLVAAVGLLTVTFSTAQAAETAYLTAEQATGTPLLTLRDAIDQALTRNPQIVMASADTATARARQMEARSYWLPRADATASSVRSNNPVFVFGSLLEQGRFGPQHFDPAFLNNPPPFRNDRLILNVRYSFFDQLRRFNATKQAARGVTRSTAAAEETRQRVISDVISRFYGVTVAQQKQAVASEAVKTAESAAQATRNRVEQGLGIQSDLLAAEVQLAQFRQQEIEAEGDVAVARAALAVALQRPVDEQLFVDANLPERSFPAVELIEARARALATRGDISAADAGVEAAEMQLRTARGSFLPRLDGFANWAASGSTFNDRNSDRTAGLIASIDIFDGSKFARVAEARAGIESARAYRSMMHDKVVMETVSAWHRVRSAQQKVEVASRSAEQAQAAARIVHDRYENGLTTITEELRAQTALVGARLGLLAARYEYITGSAELLRSTGGLHEADLFQ